AVARGTDRSKLIRIARTAAFQCRARAALVPRQEAPNAQSSGHVDAAHRIGIGARRLLVGDLLVPPDAHRLVGAAGWARGVEPLHQQPIGLFGASTSGAARVAAADRPKLIAAVVSRGGWPDLAGALLSRVAAPTLLIVGEHDESVMRLNEDAKAGIRTEARLEIVPGATHLFEEPGALERVVALAGGWFDAHLRRHP